MSCSSVAIAAAIATMAVGAPASAYDTKKSASGQDLHWEVPALTYHLDPSLAQAATGAAAGAAAAAEPWSSVEGAPALTVVQGGGGAAPGFDGLNTVFFAPEGSPVTGGALAVTVLTYDEHGTILDADIVVDGRYRFAVLPASSVPPDGAQPVSNEGTSLASSSAPFDLPHVLAHELGHSLGLADETSNSSALMFLYSAPGAASPRAPTSDDRSGIASLYDSGTPTGGAGCGAAISPRTPSCTSSRAALIASAGLLAWLLARRRRDRASKSFAFVAVSMTALALVPAERAAHPSERAIAQGAAHGRVSRVESRIAATGMFETRATVETTVCRRSPCPRESTVLIYGGSVGGLHQDVGGRTSPQEGDELEVSFAEETGAARVVAR